MTDLKYTVIEALRVSAVGLAAVVLLLSPARRAAATSLSAPVASGAADREDELRQAQTDHETKVLTIGTNGTLEVKNVSGDVTVTAGAGREARIDITRRSRGRSDEAARRGLQQVTVIVDQQGDRGSIATQYPRESQGHNDYSVDVTIGIVAPAGTRVNASSVSGNVRVENLKGDISVNVVSGNVAVVGGGNVVEARTISGDALVTNVSGESLSLSTVSGNVAMDRVTARRVEAESTSGNVRATAATVSERASLHSLSGQVTYAGTISKSGRYELRSHSGDVSFDPAEGTGYDLQASTFSGRITPPKGASSSVISTEGAKAVHATIGSGGATVSLATFSGNVQVGR